MLVHGLSFQKMLRQQAIVLAINPLHAQHFEVVACVVCSVGEAWPASPDLVFPTESAAIAYSLDGKQQQHQATRCSAICLVYHRSISPMLHKTVTL
jgi:hypothetical protein